MSIVTNYTLATLSDALAAQTVTSRDITEACLARIDAMDGDIGAFLQVDKEGALAAADAADARLKAGERLGPLDGVPVALKDNFLLEGSNTTAGSRILENFVAPYDSTSGGKLKTAGAVVLGKLNLDEFAMGSSNENSAFKPCKNPWNTEKTPGGSSGGSAAAIAASMCFGTLGTDTGGSIRQPASFCGTVGIKPTYGRVSRYGVVAFASSLDQVGPFAHDVKSAALMLGGVAGFDPNDSTSVDTDVPDYTAALTGDITGLKVGLPREYFDVEGLDDSVKAAMQAAKDALTARGAELVEISLPHTKYAVATYYIVATAEASSNLARYDGVRYGPRRGEKDGLAAMYTETRGQLFGDEVKRRIMLGTYVLSAGYYDAYYKKAQRVRRKFAEDFAAAFEKVDVILAPTAPTPAFGIGEKAADPMQMYLSDIFTISANLAGLPAMSQNVGFSADGLPIGAQLLAKAFDESTMLSAAYALEQELGLADRPS